MNTEDRVSLYGHNLIRKVPGEEELKAYFYQLMTTNFGFADELDEYVHNQLHYKNGDLFEKISYKDILKVLLHGDDCHDYFPEEIFYFGNESDNPFSDYKIAPHIFTGVLLYTKEFGGLIITERFNAGIYQLFNTKGQALSFLCDFIEVCNSGKIFLQEMDSSYWSEFEFTEGELTHVANHVNFVYEDYEYIESEGGDPMSGLFPTYSFINPGLNILNDLSGKEVEFLLKDPNFSFKFSNLNNELYLQNPNIEAYQLLIPYYYNNPELAIVAVESNALAFISLSPELQNSRSFIIKLLTEGNKTYIIYPFLNNEWKKDHEIVRLCLRWRVDILEQLSPVSDKDLIVNAIKINGSAIQYASEELLSDRDFKMEAVQTNSDVWKFLDEEDKTDKLFAIEAVRQNGNLFRLFLPELRADQEIVLAAVNQINEALKNSSKDPDTNKFYEDFPELAEFIDPTIGELPF